MASEKLVCVMLMHTIKFTCDKIIWNFDLTSLNLCFWNNWWIESSNSETNLMFYQKEIYNVFHKNGDQIQDRA